MIIYMQTEYTSTVVGGQIVGVCCEKCHCEYFFELRRVGQGTGIAPYSIGKEKAQQTADEKAKKDIAARLMGEAELVPCPKCHWINDELVVGYRRSCYRGCAPPVIIGAVIGIVSSLIAAWFISQGPPADRAAIPYFLILAPLTFVGLATAALNLVAWLRRRIQPNSNYPLDPVVPVGTPSAMIVDRTSGNLVPAIKDSPNPGDLMPFAFSVGKHRVPDLCCECLSNSNLRHFVQLPAIGTTDVRFPRCDECTRVARRHRMFAGGIGFVLTMLIGSVIVLLLKLETIEFSVLLGFTALVSFGVAAFAASFADRPVSIVRADETRGIIYLNFRNPQFSKSISAT